MIRHMRHTDVIMQLGGPRKVAERIGTTERRVRGWRDRDSIPARYWPGLIREAKRQKVRLKYEELVGYVADSAA